MLIDELKSLPNSPGIYQYFDKNAKLLYVGKAKNLKNRVKSYFNADATPNSNLSPRIAKMISQAVHIEWITTQSEQDALILENSFIKQLHPKYNILLRDDKTYPYICLDLNSDFPRFEITRKVLKGSNIKYFGPFFRGANEILEALYLEFKLVQKRSCLKEKKGCLFHQINRCYAPCLGLIDKNDYAKIVNEAIKKIKNPELLIPNLEKTMLNLAQNENYEEAAKIRDQIKTINDTSVKIQIDLAKLEDFEVISVNVNSGFVCGVRFSIRDGRVCFCTHSIKPAQDMIESDLEALYSTMILDAFTIDQPVGATKIYTYAKLEDEKILTDILNLRHNKKFQITQPKIAEKKELVDIAYQNALEFIKKHIKTNDYTLAREIQDLFELNNLPLKIEIFDNSHLFGSAPVGAMVVWENGEFNKAKYRHMHLQDINDYDQMSKLLTHRAKSFDKAPAPDLWIIDGGDALLNLANQIIKSSGANVDIIAISKEKIDAKANRAKGRASDKIYTNIGKFSLNPNDTKLQFIQRLRDEAHRFAISFHQKSRQKIDIQSSQLATLGISKGSIIKLINYFGSFENIQNASFDEIKKVTNKSVAQKITKS
ncbi:excinuclease ABC subunit UvrC [Campylobacter porcelli]|uniref:UvrABC system protein C n=1 Tax=Campylobacter porcelli TaxID=1660073 RepID=A0A1X9SW45_9BACT|nr:excinuclease ABC subunit UvrC [Campylobacter sp. RM6137]ARR00470.1 UvrABC nucleotide excision repair complex, subunit UvrC [Campylobacter sp. RM6137]